MLQNGENETAIANSAAIPLTEFEFSQTTVLNNYDNRTDEGCKIGEVDNEYCALNKSALLLPECNDLWMTPGSTVWAKNGSQIWWPAKIMGEQSTSVSEEDNCVTGRILVQYYGNDKCVWLDPAGDVSQFNECFEERSCNPMEAFQDALRQALNTKEQPSCCKQLDTDLDKAMAMGQHEQSSDAQSDKCIESSSSKTKEKFVESGRGKRTRKPKVHFDEVNFSANKSARKMRRFKIMRYLGLAAPIGSPFSLTSRW
ncbi:hypothetical protein Scep_005259 [Stephania cephalantha]|uniref:PWWP domain-containing protein n=1 Tax=Stephania cephalantha TaxID=152367 RepID=A0AAP0KWJ4_9MAGN